MGGGLGDDLISGVRFNEEKNKQDKKRRIYTKSMHNSGGMNNWRLKEIRGICA